jgi:hypothetical protein
MHGQTVEANKRLQLMEHIHGLLQQESLMCQLWLSVVDLLFGIVDMVVLVAV